jgi:spore germination protein GerM
VAVVVVAVLAASWLGAGCGVPTDRGVEVADPESVPFGLLEPDPETNVAPDPRAASAIDVFFFHAGEQRLIPVTRRVDSGDTATVIQELEAGPSAAESSLGLQSSLIDVEVVDGVSVEGGVATVDLLASFTDLSGAEQLTAVAQLVFSLTDRPGVDRVAFTLDGEAVEVRRADGTSTSEPLDRDDFASMAPL